MVRLEKIYYSIAVPAWRVLLSKFDIKNAFVAGEIIALFKLGDNMKKATQEANHRPIDLYPNKTQIGSGCNKSLLGQSKII
jgi:hypothetical protein